jgi:hypothetical protein
MLQYNIMKGDEMDRGCSTYGRGQQMVLVRKTEGK